MAAASHRRPSRLLAVAAAGLIVAATTGCPKKGTPSEQLATSPDLATQTGQTKCGVKASAAKPLVVEWPAADRAALEARATRSLVAVRYQGCEMEVLTNCTVEGNYSYLGLNQKREGVKIKSMDELYAQLPVGAVGLEAKLERAGQLNVDMIIVGRKEAERAVFNERDLEGRCDEATHVITGLTVGAFSFYAGASADVGAGVKVGNVGVGASSGTEREVLKQDGSEDSCAAASQSDIDAPPGCGALLRVEVVPIDRIFGDGGSTVASSGSGSPTSGGGSATPDTGPTMPDDEYSKKRKLWGTLTATGYILALGGLGALYGGVYVRNKGKGTVAETDPGEARQKAISQINVGAGLLIGGAAAAGFGLALAVFANTRLKKLNQQRSAFIGPSPMPNGAGVAARVRF
ncbi:hypothetical protein [Paraliomyxa miuraensis]|uniref:hypothetical protein n=1 Tax=Paraliomyxa miuraensis TaxID=376150 RepID=UPI0022576BDC|nr:hypothetical protein [Paraliomyxa miuraensis]MCX4242264.1 hypothetical protein [Paraliomyxa miuraensis]